MTAQVLTRLSVRLENMGYYKTESDDEYMTPPETTQRHQGDGKLPSASKTKITEPNSSSTEIYSSVPGTVGAIGTAVAVKSSKGVTKKTKKVPAKSAFAHPGRFDLLLSFEEEESNVLAHGDALKEAGYDGDSDEEEPNPVLQPEVSILDMDLSPKPALATIIAPQPRSTLSYNAPEYVPLQHTVAGQGNVSSLSVHLPKNRDTSLT